MRQANDIAKQISTDYSKCYDNAGNFEFTLERMHPLTNEEEQARENTYYEYFCPDGKIPEFPIDELDLNLFKRKFRTGLIIKLYSYDLLPSSRSVISGDLNQSILMKKVDSK